MARLVTGLAVVALVALSGVLLARDAAALEPLLRGVETDLGRAQAAIADADDAAAREAVQAAAAGVTAAEARADGPLWAAAEVVPRFGASARAVTGGVALADATVGLADAAVDEALVLVQDGAATFVGPGGQVDTSALTTAAEALGALPLEPVRQARGELAALPASGLVGPTSAARDAAVTRATTVIGQVERGRTGAQAFASFLGGSEPRTYLLAVQNPGELRGTGGLISYLALVTVRDGRIEVRPSEQDELVADAISRSGATVGFDVDNFVPRPVDYAERYDSNAGGAILQSTNLDPDLPTVGPVLLRLFEARSGQSVDGAILVDPFALAEILGATGGPLDVPPFALEEAPTLPPQLTEDNVASTLLVDVYDAFGGLNPVRRQFDDAVTLAVLQRLTSGDWEPSVLARALAEAAAARRLQLYSSDDAEQAGFTELGIGGAMTDPDDVVDMLAVTGVNAGPDKSDAHVSHRLTADVVLQARPGALPWQLRRQAEVTVEVDNPLLPQEHDDYITGTNVPAPVGTSAGPRTRDALNRTWFTIWSPDTTQLTAVRDGINDKALRTGVIHEHRAIDYFLETPSASTAAFSAPYTGPVDLEQVGGRHLYELVLWRQAKAIPDVWDLTVTPPPGFTVDEVGVVGGGPPHTGVGPADPEPVTAEVTGDGTVRLSGTVTRDTTLQVWLTTE